jgi:hypothetical protein
MRRPAALYMLSGKDTAYEVLLFDLRFVWCRVSPFVCEIAVLVRNLLEYRLNWFE